jgi:hypothetical protein
MADVTITPARGTYKKDATAAYWGAGDRIIVKGGTMVEVWDETNVVPYTIKIIGDGGVEAERVVGASGSWWMELGKDAEIQIDIKRTAAGAAFSVAFLVT